MRINLVLVVLAGLLLAACAPAASDPLESRSRNVPTTEPPPWVESDAVITLGNVAQIALLGRLDSVAEPSTVFAHSLSPDGTRLAGLDNEQLLIWDLLSGEVVVSTARSSANVVYFSPEKTEVYTVTPQGRVTIYDAERGTTRHDFEGIGNYNEQVAFYAEDGWLAFGNLRGQVKIWDPLDRLALGTIDAHSLRITALAFSADGQLLATASDDRTVKIWDWRERELLWTLTDDAPGIRLAFSPDAAQIAVGTRENTRLWSLETGTRQLVIDTAPGGVNMLAYTPDGRFLINGGQTPEMVVWNPQTGGLVARLPGTGGDWVSSAFSPDGTLMVTSVLGGPATVWDLTSITSTTVNRADLNVGDRVYSVDWASDGRLITLFGARGSVYILGVGAQA